MTDLHSDDSEKLIGGSSWSWLWVLSPLWITTGLLLTVVGMQAAHKVLFD